MAEKRKSNNNRLRVRRVVHVPLHEVSGIGVHRGRSGQMSLIAVGDRVAKIAWFPLPVSIGAETAPRIGEQKGPLGDGSRRQRSPRRSWLGLRSRGERGSVKLRVFGVRRDS